MLVRHLPALTVCWLMACEARTPVGPSPEPAPSGPVAFELIRDYGTAPFVVGDDTTAVAWGPEGRIFVATRGRMKPATLSAWSPTGTRERLVNTSPISLLAVVGDRIHALSSEGIEVFDAATLSRLAKRPIEVAPRASASFDLLGRLLLLEPRGANLTPQARTVSAEPDVADTLVAIPPFDRALWDPAGTRRAAVTGRSLTVSDVSGAPLANLAFEGASPKDLAFSSDGRLLAFSARLGLSVLDVGSGAVSVLVAESTADRPMHSDPANGEPRAYYKYEDVTGLAFSPDGARLASISSDGDVALFDLATHSQVAKRRLDAARGIAFSPDGSALGALAEGARLRLLTVPDLAPLVPETELGTGRIAASSRYLAIVEGSFWVRVLDRTTGETVARADAPGAVAELEFDNGGGRVIASGAIGGPTPGFLAAFDVASASWSPTIPLDAPARDMDVDAGHVAVLVGQELRSYDEAALAPLGAFELPKGSFGVALSGDMVAIGRAGGTVEVRDRESGRAITTLAVAGCADAGNSVLGFSAHGARLAAACNGRLAVWDCTGWKPRFVSPPTEAQTFVRSIEFSPDGRLVFSSGGSVVAREVAGGAIVGEIELDADAGWIGEVGGTAEGSTLLVGRVWGTAIALRVAEL